MKASDYFKIGSDKRRGDPGYVMSQSDLKLFSKGAWAWINGRGVEETDAMRYGSAVDCIYLTPEDFSENYAIVPKVYPSTSGAKKGETVMKPWTLQSNYCKQWVKDQAAAGKEVITEKDLMAAKAAVRALEGHEAATYLLEDTDRQVVCQWEWTDPVTRITVPLKCMIDIAAKNASYLADFKTTNEATLSGFRRTAANFRYDVQGAFYLWGFRECFREVENFAFVVSESKHPYPVGTYHLTGNDIAVGRSGGRDRWGKRDGYLEMLTRYCRCLDSGDWPMLNEGEVIPLDLYRE